MLTTALQYGLSEDEFYNLSLAEFGRWFEAREKQLDIESRRRFMENQILSASIAARFSKNGYNFPSYDEIYQVKKQQDESDDQTSEANFLKFAQARNMRYGGKNG